MITDNNEPWSGEAATFFCLNSVEENKKALHIGLDAVAYVGSVTIL